MKNLIILIAIILLGYQAKAQQSFTIATDPLSLALSGYEFEAAYSFDKNRVSVSYLGGELTPWFGQAGDFKETSQGVLDIAYSRWLGDEQKGFSYGLAYTYFTSFKVENNDGETLEKNPSKVSLRLTYAWFPFKKINLFLEPTMSFGFMIGDEDLNFATGEKFDKKSFIGNGPIFNIGYKFNIN